MNRVDALPSLPARPGDGHKGTFGRVMIIAGSRGMSGAACLSAMSALRGGSGLVYVAVPESIMSIVAGYEPSWLTIPLPEDDDGRVDASALRTLLDRSSRMDAVAIGPGLGQSTGLRQLVVELFRSLEMPLIVDADGLNLLSKSRDVLSTHAGPRVLTPHVGEFSRLTGVTIDEIASDREGHAGRFAGEHDVTLLLKGPGTIVTDGQQVFVNTTGNSGMGTGGTGDILTGLIASLIGQGMPAFDAAQLGAWLHGTAGDIAADLFGQRAMIASDLVDCLSDAWSVAEDVG